MKNENNDLNDTSEEVKKRTDTIVDFISGQVIKVSPEEIEATQVFSKKLVEDFGYERNQIQTRPQFKIKQSPSGIEKYPIDIAVFKDKRKDYDNLYIIVECKRKNRTDGLKQLKIYLGLSSAQIGVWFNGEQHIYLQKILDTQGKVSYRELPTIPKKGQRIEDIGRYKRADLKPTNNLKAIFKDMRNHLAGNITGITRDESIAQEIMNILFCKIYDEINTSLNDEVTFRAGVNEDKFNVKDRIFR
jgi:type I restriction enzyme M protein